YSGWGGGYPGYSGYGYPGYAAQGYMTPTLASNGVIIQPATTDTTMAQAAVTGTIAQTGGTGPSASGTSMSSPTMVYPAYGTYPAMNYGGYSYPANYGGYYYPSNTGYSYPMNSGRGMFGWRR